MRNLLGWLRLGWLKVALKVVLPIRALVASNAFVCDVHMSHVELCCVIYAYALFITWCATYIAMRLAFGSLWSVMCI